MILESKAFHKIKNIYIRKNMAEETEIKMPTSVGSSKNQESSRKTSTFALLITPKPLMWGSQQIVKNS